MKLLSTKTLSSNIKDHLTKIGTSVVEHPLIEIHPLHLNNQKIQSMLIFTFFCGKKRRSEIESLFKIKNMNVEIHELYDTLFINKKIKGPFDGIIFFSPSAVLSFFENNKWPKDSHGFCIGKSTAETLKKYTTNYSEAKHPNEDQLLQTIINYFSKHYVKK